MVETVTLNPALDRTLRVESIRMGDSNCIVRENRCSGHKGSCPGEGPMSPVPRAGNASNAC